jgi:hypothetical protein
MRMLWNVDEARSSRAQPALDRASGVFSDRPLIERLNPQSVSSGCGVRRIRHSIMP